MNGYPTRPVASSQAEAAGTCRPAGTQISARSTKLLSALCHAFSSLGPSLLLLWFEGGNLHRALLAARGGKHLWNVIRLLPSLQPWRGMLGRGMLGGSSHGAGLHPGLPLAAPSPSLPHHPAPRVPQPRQLWPPLRVLCCPRWRPHPGPSPGVQRCLRSCRRS